MKSGARDGVPAGGPETRPLRFLMLNWRDPRNPLAGGAERVTQAYLRALVQRGHHVDWFTFGFEGGQAEEVIEGVQVHRGGGLGSAILSNPAGYKRVRRPIWPIDPI